MNRFFSWAAMVICLILVLCNTPAEASWFPLELPTPQTKTALATLQTEKGTWVGYANYGLVFYDDNAQIQIRLTPKEGLPGPTVTDLALRGKELWIATSDGLAYRSETGGLTTFTARDGLPDNGITCLGVRDGVLYAGTMKGLVRFRGESFDVITDEKGLPSAHITALAAYEKGMIVGTPKGWATLDGDMVESHTRAGDGLPFEWITSAAFFKYRKAELSAQSNVSNEWFVLGSAGGGLIFYHDKAYTSLRKDDEGPASDWITAVQHEPVTNTLWVGSQNGLAAEKIEDGVWRRFSAQSGGLISDLVKDLSVRALDIPIQDYEILLGKGECPGCAKAADFSASWSRSIATNSYPSFANPGQAGPVASGMHAILDCPTEYRDPNPHPCTAGCWDLAASGAVPRPRILHIYQTWVAIGTEEGAELLYEKKLPHHGQGNIYSYLANKGYEIKGLGVGETVYAGTYPPGAGEGFLFMWTPNHIRFECGFADPPDTSYTSTINTLSTTAEGYPAVGACTVGRGGLAILDLPAANSSSLANPWRILGGKEGLTDLNITTMFREGSSLLVGTGLLGKSGSVFRFKDGKFETFSKAGLAKASNVSLFPSPVTCLWGDGKKVYVGTKGDGVYYFDGDSWTRYDTLNSKSLTSDAIQTLTFRNGILYVGTKKGLDCISSAGNHHFNVTEWLCWTNNVEYLLWDDSDGDGDQMVLWIGTHDGFSRVSTPLGDMQHGGKGRSIGEGTMIWPDSSPTMKKIVIHSWPGNPKEERADVCPFDGMPGNRVTCMAYDDINLWIGTDNGICRFRK